MPCLLYKVGFVQTHGSCTRLCRGELQLSVKLITYFSMLLVVYMFQLVSICLECTVHAKNFSQDQLVFSYVIKVGPCSLT
jgi:hypothetical protein